MPRMMLDAEILRHMADAGEQNMRFGSALKRPSSGF
jgi:hypothetical protein